MLRNMYLRVIIYVVLELRAYSRDYKRSLVRIVMMIQIKQLINFYKNFSFKEKKKVVLTYETW